MVPNRVDDTSASLKIFLECKSYPVILYLLSCHLLIIKYFINLIIYYKLILDEWLDTLQGRVICVLPYLQFFLYDHKQSLVRSLYLCSLYKIQEL